jgi:hypothetical protein
MPNAPRFCTAVRHTNRCGGPQVNPFGSRLPLRKKPMCTLRQSLSLRIRASAHASANHQGTGEHHNQNHSGHAHQHQIPLTSASNSLRFGYPEAG